MESRKAQWFFGTLTMTKIKPITVIHGMGRFMPDDEGRVLTDTKLPADAQKELENFFEHIIKKYGLDI